MRAVQTNKTTSIVSSTRRNTVNNNYTCISLLGSPPSPQFEERWFGGLLCSSTEGSTKSSRSREKSWNRWKSGKATERPSASPWETALATELASRWSVRLWVKASAMELAMGSVRPWVAAKAREKARPWAALWARA